MRSQTAARCLPVPWPLLKRHYYNRGLQCVKVGLPSEEEKGSPMGRGWLHHPGSTGRVDAARRWGGSPCASKTRFAEALGRARNPLSKQELRELSTGENLRFVD